MKKLFRSFLEEIHSYFQGITATFLRASLLFLFLLFQTKAIIKENCWLQAQSIHSIRVLSLSGT